MGWILPKVFFKKINNEGSFHVPKDCQHDLLFWTEASRIFSLPWTDLSSQARRSKVHLKSFFLTKKCFSLHITHFFENFTWFAFLSDQKSDDRPLFKPRTLCLICSQYFCEIEKISTTNHFQTIHNLKLWKKNSGKKFILLFQKKSLYSMIDPNIYIYIYIYIYKCWKNRIVMNLAVWQKYMESWINQTLNSDVDV